MQYADKTDTNYPKEKRSYLDLGSRSRRTALLAETCRGSRQGLTQMRCEDKYQRRE